MIYDKFKRTIKKYGMLSGGERIVAGVSGGVDSMVLLYLLNRFVDEYGGDLIAAHLNHGLRDEEADRDERFVSKAAESMGIPFVSKKIDLKGSVNNSGRNMQELARSERYEFFQKISDDRNGEKIAVGHHADDQAETVIMRIVRGSGIRGLGAIPPVRVNIIRPLIEITREEIARFASEEGIRYIDDSSNKEGKYLRNRLRRELMPALKAYNPRICHELSMLSAIARDVESYLGDEASAAFERIKSSGIETENVVSLDITLFNSLPQAIRTNVIFKAVENISGRLRGIYSNHIEEVCELLMIGKSGSSLDLPGAVKVCIEYGNIVFFREEKEIAPSYAYVLNLSGRTAIPEAGVVLLAQRTDEINGVDAFGKTSICIDMDRIASSLEVRNFREGDRIRFKGMPGRKKIKDFFIDEKIPKRIRKIIPLLVSGDDILWIIGWRRGAAASPDSQTRNGLRISKI